MKKCEVAPRGGLENSLSIYDKFLLFYLQKLLLRPHLKLIIYGKFLFSGLQNPLLHLTFYLS